MKKFILILIFLTSPIFGCGAMSEEQEFSNDKIFNVLVTGSQIKIQVISFGCTDKKSFQLIWQNSELTIKRIRADHCRRMPFKKWLTYELPPKISQFSLTNIIHIKE